MTDIEAEINRRVAAAGLEASRSFARMWWVETQKIAEEVTDPQARWEIMVRALRRVGWSHTGAP